MRGRHEGSIFFRKPRLRESHGHWYAAVTMPGGTRVERAAEWDNNTRKRAMELLAELNARRLLGPPVPPPPAMPLPPSLTGARRVTIPTCLGSQFVSVASSRGWVTGSAPEARIALALDRLGLTPQDTAVQCKVGRLRIDFAAPDVKVGIEVDGPHHRLPEIALRDLERDATLSAAGWMIFRIDAYGSDEEIDNRVARIVRFIRAERLGR